jgi:AcrR family transcriptional regulator
LTAPDQTLTGARRERRIQRKRGEIINAATQIFAQKGYASATTKDIADQADIGEGTLYNYFPSKREILLAIMDENRVHFNALFSSPNGLANRASLVELFDQSIAIVTSRANFLRTILAEAWLNDEVLNTYVIERLKQVSGLLQDFISSQVAAGVFRPIDPDLGARLAMGMFFALVLPSLRGVEPPPTPEQRHILSETVVRFLLDGIRTREGES